MDEPVSKFKQSPGGRRLVFLFISMKEDPTFNKFGSILLAVWKDSKSSWRCWLHKTNIWFALISFESELKSKKAFSELQKIILKLKIKALKHCKKLLGRWSHY